MNAELLLQHFDRISEAPDAIPRLRRFILDLAVRGKLVEQDPHDEMAAELLKRIQAEKARLVKGGLERKEKTPILLKVDEIPYSLPGSWKWSQLAEIGFISPRNVADIDLSASFVPMPMISAEYGVPNRHEVRSWGEIKSGFTHFAEGDVGLAKITPCFENGKSTIFRQLTGGIGAGTTELHIVRPIFVIAEFMLIFLKCPHYIKTGIPKMTGTAGQKRVPTEYFTSSPFPLPPLAEQHRIVAKVDELMALCDQLEAERNKREARRNRLVASSLNRISTTTAEEAKDATRFHLNHLPRLTTRTEHIKQLRQTILNLAVRGRLVPQDSNDEPAAELLRRVAVEKKTSGGTAPKIGDGGDKVPTGWVTVTLVQYSLDICTGPFGTALHQSDYIVGGIPLVNPSHMINDRIVPDDRISVPQNIAERLASYRLETGDIVMARRGEVGRAALVEAHQKGWLCGTGSFFLRFTPEINRHFFLLLLRSTQIRSYLAGKAVGTTMVNLNHNILKHAQLEIPPLAEQYRIVAKVDELMALCDQLETQLITTEADSRRLVEAVLRDALNTSAMVS